MSDGFSTPPLSQLPGVRSEIVEGPDGCPLCVHTVGESGPVVVIANGHGGNMGIWAPVLDRLNGKIRIVTWDYRGHYGSGIPRETPTVADHVRDLFHITDRYELRKFGLVGWSLGVQVALESYRFRPDAVGAMYLMHGVHDRLMSRIYDGRLSPLLSPAARLVSKVEPFTQPFLSSGLRQMIESQIGPAMFKRLGFVLNPSPEFISLAVEILSLDLSQYLQTALVADDHDTESWLGEIEIPVLVSAGLKDVLTPPAQIRRAYERLPAASYHEFDGSHFPMVEQPDLVAELVERTGQLASDVDCSDEPNA